MLKLGESHNELKVVDDQIGCPTSAQEIARTLVNILPYIETRQLTSGIYNFCSDSPCSWYEFAKEIGKQIIDGQELPIIQPEVHMEVKNKKTGTDYESEEHAQQDVDNPSTDTTADDVEKNIEIKVVKLPDVFGKTKDD